MPDDPRGPSYRLRDFEAEDIEIYGTLAGTDSLAAATLQFRGWNSSGDLVWDSDSDLLGATAEITSAVNRTYSATVGLDLEPGVYRWEVARTDTGKRTVCVHGFETVSNRPRS